MFVLINIVGRRVSNLIRFLSIGVELMILIMIYSYVFRLAW